MGCRISKPEDATEPVILCRDRRNLILAAASHRRLLTSAHVAYFQSLSRVSDALLEFVQKDVVSISDLGIKPGSVKENMDSGHLEISDCDSDSDSPFHSSCASVVEDGVSNSDSGIKPGNVKKDKDSGHLEISDCSSIESILEDMEEIEEIETENNYYCMKAGSMVPNIVYQQPVIDNANRVYIDTGYGYNNYSYNYNYNYPVYGSNLNSEPVQMQNIEERRDYESVLVPVPPPPVPEVSGWDFLNPFDSYQQFIDNYNVNLHNGSLSGSASIKSSPNSSEVREREGIPDLEDETEQEFIKGKKQMKFLNNETGHEGLNKVDNIEISDDNKGLKPIKKLRKVSFEMKQRKYLNKGTGQTGHEDDNKVDNIDISHEDIKKVKKVSFDMKQRKYLNKGTGQTGHEDDNKVDNIDISHEDIKKLKKVSFEMKQRKYLNNGTGQTGHEDDNKEDDIDISDENVKKVKKVSFEMIESLNEDSFRGSDIRGIKEVVKKIKEEFDNLINNESDDVARLLEAGTMQYRSKIKVLKLAFSRILGIFLPSMPSQASNKNYKTMGLNEVGFNNLSCILDRLYSWDKKLYKEVKEEEKLRLKYEKKSKQLNTLVKKGAEGNKIHATQMATRDLATRLDVSLRQIEFISKRIHKVRDEELQPLLIEMLQGFKRMWRFIFECHHKQFQLILKSKPDKLFIPETRLINTNSSNNNNNPTIKLETELLNWSLNFKNWIKAQNSYIQTLNRYFLKWLNEENESETLDIFIFLKDWTHLSERVSENGVVVINAINSFAFNVHDLLESQEKREYIPKDLSKQVEDNGLTGHKMITGFDEFNNTMDFEKGLGTVFEALEGFSSEILRDFDDVRVPNSGGVT